MKLTNIISLTSSSVVNNGENIPNVFITKQQHKKKKEIKLGKTTYGVGGGVGINVSPPSGESSCDAGGGDGGGGGD